ncbi:MAG: TolC family protein [Sphingobacteriales bacterium]|nr:TolC family protein [Sphingobacteriales bacterium]
MRYLITAFLSFYSALCLAQADSSRMLTLPAYLGIIRQFHPIARQADLLSEQAKATLRIARGGFDPLLYSDYERKEFYGKNYYSFFSSELKVPGWFGIELKTGYDAAYGLNINPESNIPENGIYYLGISLPVLKNMLIDKKRAELFKARLFVKSSQQERLLMLNDLLMDAVQSYYNWCEAEQIKSIYEEALLAALVRYRATVRTYELGDRAAIDTTEALTQYQQRLFQLNEAGLNAQKARLIVSNFLWQSDNIPYTLPDNIQPQPIDSAFIDPLIRTPLESLDILLSQINAEHPVINQYTIKLKQLDIERKLRKEGLKPALNINYNLLSPGFFNYTTPDSRVFTNYYKLGFNFSMPLTFAQGRGELQQTRLKITDTKLQLTQKQRELETKLTGIYTELNMLKGQINLYRETLKNYETLLKGETRRFDIGESNLFLVNTRENTAITAEQKLIELHFKYLENEAKLKWVLAAFTR